MSGDISGSGNKNGLMNMKKQFVLSKEGMQKIVDDFVVEMEEGLRSGDKKSSLKMIPTFVSRFPEGEEKGTYYALDIGGTNFRVMRFDFLGNSRFNLTSEEHFAIPTHLMSGEQHQLFDFVADSILSLDTPESMSALPTDTYQVDTQKFGFTFSFPVHQTALNKGELIVWTKGFQTRGVEGKDVVDLLQEALARKVKGHPKNSRRVVQVTALVNDTVGTLASGRFNNPKCCVGIILGTGTNAAYIERTTNILKLPAEIQAKSEFMAINMEWGAFGDIKRESVLPITDMDSEIDKESINPGKQLFEKMISGFYLGEIVRLCLVKLYEQKVLFQNEGVVVSEKLVKQHAFESRYVSDVSENKFDSLEKELGFKGVTEQDKEIMHEVCEFVVERAAQLTCCGIVAIFTHTKTKPEEGAVGIDGSVFEHHPTFKEKLSRNLDSFGFGKCDVFLSKDGSGIGAALLASAADLQQTTVDKEPKVTGNASKEKAVTASQPSYCCRLI